MKKKRKTLSFWKLDKQHKHGKNQWKRKLLICIVSTVNTGTNKKTCFETNYHLNVLCAVLCVQKYKITFWTYTVKYLRM